MNKLKIVPNMKKVSFKMAKVLKEAGYPQEIIKQDISYDHNGNLCNDYNANGSTIYARPTYLDVWLWLWREKGIQFEQGANVIYDSDNNLIKAFKNIKTIDPEEAIIMAIEYLVNNDLIK